MQLLQLRPFKPLLNPVHHCFRRRSCIKGFRCNFVQLCNFKLHGCIDPPMQLQMQLRSLTQVSRAFIEPLWFCSCIVALPLPIKAVFIIIEVGTPFSGLINLSLFNHSSQSRFDCVSVLSGYIFNIRNRQPSVSSVFQVMHNFLT